MDPDPAGSENSGSGASLTYTTPDSGLTYTCKCREKTRLAKLSKTQGGRTMPIFGGVNKAVFSDVAVPHKILLVTLAFHFTVL